MKARALAGPVALSVLSAGAVACTAILGSFEVGPTADVADTGATDTGTADDAGTDASARAFTGAVAVTAGARHTCALTGDGKVYCWGDNTSGQLGADPSALARSATPVLVAGLPAMKQIEAGLFHTCAVESDGPRAWCWGKNDCGQLGRGTTDDPAPTPALVGADGGPAVGAVEVASGENHTCAVDASGAVYCWGCTKNAVLGPAAPTEATSPPVVAFGGNQAQTMSAGPTYSCAVFNSLSATGTGPRGIGCWGTEAHGELGDGPPTTSSTGPTFATTALGGAGANGAARVSAGGGHACAVDADQKLFCWGQSDFGQTGSGTDQAAPIAVPGVQGPVADVAAGGAFTCYRTTAGGVFCFGNNEEGQLGRGTKDAQPHADAVAVVAPGDPAAALSGDALATGREHACAVTGGEVACWGSNAEGQLGDGTTGGARPVPVVVVSAAP